MLIAVKPFLELPVLFKPFTEKPFYFESDLKKPSNFNDEEYMVLCGMAGEKFREKTTGKKGNDLTKLVIGGGGVIKDGIVTFFGRAVSQGETDGLGSWVGS